jgi:predicted MPP superfamily phosphohydrolase
MRNFSIYTIILACFAILTVDIVAFYWLQSITMLIDSNIIKNSINFLFWFFTIGLVSSIIILKFNLDKINPKRKQILISSLYGLTISSLIPKLIFIIIIASLYFTNYMFSEKESLIIVPIVGLFSGFLPFFIILYGITKTLYRFKIEHLSIKLKELPDNFNGLRIVQISDLHLGSFNYKYHILDRAIKIINHLKPDLILFTGDLVNNYAWELNGWEKHLKKLSAKIGKFAVLGNHDYGDYSKWKSRVEKKENFEAIKHFYAKINFKLLLNEAAVVEINGEKISVLGVENWGSPPFKQYGNLKEAMKEKSSNSFEILLSHDPSHWKEEVVKLTNINLTLSGHTHGMQAGFILKNRKWSPIKYKYKQWAGLYQENNQYLYVNRGLGWMGFPGRIGVRPEITFIELKN